MPTTVFTFTYATDDSGDEGFSFRCVIPITAGGQGQVRVTLGNPVGSGDPFAINHCAIGVWDGTGNPGWTNAAPVELTFSGGHGFSLPTGGIIVSDWVNLAFLSSDSLVVIFDVNATAGNGEPGLGGIGLPTGFTAWQSPTTPLATWNVQQPVAAGWAGLGRGVGVSLIETQSSGLTVTGAALTVGSPVIGTPAITVFVPLVLGATSIDGGLLGVHTLADKLYICSQPPADFVSASVTYALGVKNFGVGNVFGAPAAGSPTGRKITSAVITDGAVTANGTVTCWAVVDSVNSNLLATGPLSGGAVVAIGQVWTLTALTLRLPSS